MVSGETAEVTRYSKQVRDYVNPVVFEKSVVTDKGDLCAQASPAGEHVNSSHLNCSLPECRSVKLLKAGEMRDGLALFCRSSGSSMDQSWD